MHLLLPPSPSTPPTPLYYYSERRAWVVGAAVSRRPNQFKFGSPVSRTLTTDAHKRAAVRIINQCDTLQAHMRVMDS